jgi:M6 family metalloprotease-like protein
MKPTRPPALAAAMLALALAIPTAAADEKAEAGTRPIPVLDSKGDVYKTEGVTDPLIYGNAVGRKKVIMLYLDFADAVMEIDTKEHAEKVMGGDRFEKIFGEQSYGKLSFDIEHVHGWRRLPGKAGDYSSKTTDSHRELFLQVFKLYPEIDFREYDYINANMPRIGNTAFGEREDLAIPYRDTRIKVAMNLSSPSPYVFAHEVAHLMGLPDLYTYGGVEGPKNPAGPWDIMSSAGYATGFLGWHRHKLEWLDADRKTYLTSGTTRLTLTPLDADHGVSMVVVPVDDPAKPSKVFVLEVAQARRYGDGKHTEAEGVLVYSVDAKIVSGQNPVIVYPKESIGKAPFHAGDTFRHAEAPFEMEVIGRDPKGAYAVEIRIGTE